MSGQTNDRQANALAVEPRIPILTGDAGVGHWNAAEALAAALHDTYGQRAGVTIAHPMDEDRLPTALREGQHDYDQVIQEMPRRYELDYQVTEGAIAATMLEEAMAVILFEVVRDLLREHEPDVVVSTFPLLQAAVGAVRSLERSHVSLITVVIDLPENHPIWLHAASDLASVPTAIAREVALENDLAPERVRVIGIPVDPAFAHKTATRPTLRASLGWQPELTTLLVVGSDRVRDLPALLRELNHSGVSIQLALVAGGRESLSQQFQETEWHLLAHRYGFVDNMPELIQASGFVLWKVGGLIVSEALACGLPLLLVDVLPGQETGNADYVVQGGAGDWAQDPLAVLETAYHWLDRGGALLAERAQRARTLGRPEAALESADLAWRAPDALPPRKENDAGGSRLVGLLERHGVVQGIRPAAEGKGGDNHA